MRIVLFSLLLTTALLGRGVRADVFFVAPVCDGGGGVCSQPGQCGADAHCTLDEANRLAAPGDMVMLLPGSYRGQIKPLANGEPGAPITYQTYGDGDARFVQAYSDGIISLRGRRFIVVSGDSPDDGLQTAPQRPPSAPAPALRMRLLPGEQRGGAFVDLCGGQHNIVSHVYMDGNPSYGVNHCLYHSDGRGGAAESAPETAYNIVQYNVIRGRGSVCGAAAATEDLVSYAFDAHHNLLQYNFIGDSSHVAVTSMLSPGVRYNAIRYNVVSNPYHTALDLWGGGHSNLVEGNLLSASAGRDNPCPGNALQHSADDTLVRYNVIARGGSADNRSAANQTGGLSLNSAVDQFSCARRSAVNNRFYNNTIAYNQGPGIALLKQNTLRRAGSGDGFVLTAGSPHCDGVRYAQDEDLSRNAFVNNLIYDNNNHAANADYARAVNVYYSGFLDDAGELTHAPARCGPGGAIGLCHDWRANAIANPPGLSAETLKLYDTPFRLDQAERILTDPLDPRFTGNFAGDPRLHAAGSDDYRLAGDSPLIDAGAPLTTVTGCDGGGGTTRLAVDDARFFQDGMGIATLRPDRIALGNDGGVFRVVATLAAVDRDNDRLTLTAPYDCAVGEGVWLYSNSRGQVVSLDRGPDIGACETGAATVTGDACRADAAPRPNRPRDHDGGRNDWFEAR